MAEFATTAADDLELLRSSAVMAGVIASGYFRKDVKNWTKDHGSPVSEADIVVETATPTYSVTGTLILIATPLFSSCLRTVTVFTGSRGPLSLAGPNFGGCISAVGRSPKRTTTDVPSIPMLRTIFCLTVNFRELVFGALFMGPI